MNTREEKKRVPQFSATQFPQGEGLHFTSEAQQAMDKTGIMIWQVIRRTSLVEALMAPWTAAAWLRGQQLPGA